MTERAARVASCAVVVPRQIPVMIFFNYTRWHTNPEPDRAAGPVPWKSQAHPGPTSAHPPRGNSGDGPDGDEPGAAQSPGHAAAATVREAKRIDLKSRIGTASFAFRGYDVTNLGRSPELLEHRAFGPVVNRILRRGLGDQLPRRWGGRLTSPPGSGTARNRPSTRSPKMSPRSWPSSSPSSSS